MITAIYRARAYSGFQLQHGGEAWQQARWHEQEAELLSAPISKSRLQSRESTLEVGCGYVIPLPVSWGVLAKPPQTGRAYGEHFSFKPPHLANHKEFFPELVFLHYASLECLKSFLPGMALALDSWGSCCGLCLKSPPEGFCVGSLVMSPASLRS